MALSVLSGPSALVSLGVSVGDVATLVSLGNRFGNWWTSPEGDKKLLDNLDIDGNTIFQRQGLIDLPRFNKRWRKIIRLLANRKPLQIEEPDMVKILGNSSNLLGNLPLFSSVFLCITSALDRFTDSTTAQTIIYNVLRELIGATEMGEDMLRAEYGSRLSGWRSSACLRGLINTSEAFRQQLLINNSILPGLMPASDAKNVEEFLLWLVGTRKDRFFTLSSDVAGIAVCLAHLGIDIVHVQGPGFGMEEDAGPCTVLYSETPHLGDISSRLKQTMTIISRAKLATVPIAEPGESISVFPATPRGNDQYRRAWAAGKKSAATVGIAIEALDDDIMYTFVDQGTEMRRTRTEISELAHHHAIIVNAEMVNGLEDCLGNLDQQTLRWIDCQTGDGTPHPNFTADDITDPNMTEESKVLAFTTFQSFFMGYFYEIFFRFVDTSTLVLKTVDGAWGFRSPEFLWYMRTEFIHIPGNSKVVSRTLSSNDPTDVVRGRSQILPVLARLFLGTSLDIPLITKTASSRETGCMGIIQGRTLLINSLLGKCKTPQEMSKFTLLDVDVGGLPRDNNSLIRPGLPTPIEEQHFLESREASELTQRDVRETGPAEDVTFNIEPDWDGDPDTALVCVRYKGRRITTISPATSDYEFLRAYGPPGSPFRQRSSLERGISIGMESLIGDDQSLRVTGYRDKIPIIFQALGQPCLRYTAVALYSCLAPTYLVADCLRATANFALAQGDKGVSKSGKTHLSVYGPVLVAGITAATDDDNRHEEILTVDQIGTRNIPCRWFL